MAQPEATLVSEEMSHFITILHILPGIAEVRAAV